MILLRKELLAVFIVICLMASVNLVKPASSALSDEDSWVEKTPMPSPHSGYQAAVVNGRIYLIGASYRYDASTNSSIVSSNNLAYDPSTDTWRTIAPMLTPRLSFAIAASNNKIYVFGGLKVIASGGLSRYSCSVNEVYDPATNTWSTAASMPTDTSSMQANTVNGKIYIIGGMIGDTAADRAVNTTLIYDPISDSWSTGASMPYPVKSYASAVVDKKIYIIGGEADYSFTQGDSAKYQTQFNQIYDSERNSWSLGSPIPAIASSAGAGATTGIASAKRVYVMGGMLRVYPGYGLNQNYAYDPSTNSWITAAPLPVASIKPTVAVVNDTIYVMGGSSDRTAFVNNWLYMPIGYGTADPSYLYQHSPPEISLLSPVTQTYNDSAVSLIFTVNKPLTWASYSLDGQQNITVTGNGTIANMTNGLHTIMVYANDTFGNIGSSQISNFTIARLKPIFSPAVTAISGISAVVVISGVIVYFKKIRHLTPS